MATAKKKPGAPAKPAAPKKSAPAAAPAKTEKAPKAPKEPKVKVERVSANGVTRPKDGSKTGEVWAIADKLSAAKGKGQFATRAEVMAEAEKAGINEATVATQYQRWRVFYAVPRTAAEPKAPKAPKAPAK